MKNWISTGAAFLMTTSIASAGGLDRTGNSYSVLYEDGNYVELSFGKVTPDVSGTYPLIPAVGFDGSDTGNMADGYTSIGVALKYNINEQIAVALFLNQPYGANATYSSGLYTGIEADWESNQIAAVVKYQANENISVFGGVRSIESNATIQLPQSATSIYTATASKDRQNGLIAGAAYERPEIALRVALTYEQGVTHEFETVEAINGATALESITEISLPDTVTLDFQTGVAPGTLVFGSVKWAEWSVWEVRPQFYDQQEDRRITGLDNDVTTYQLGVGRQINDNLSVFGRVTFEDSTGDPVSTLSPTDGSTSIGLGGSYTVDNAKITAGVEYAMLGDGTNSQGVEYSDNTALGFGVSIGFGF